MPSRYVQSWTFDEPHGMVPDPNPYAPKVGHPRRGGGSSRGAMADPENMPYSNVSLWQRPTPDFTPVAPESNVNNDWSHASNSPPESIQAMQGVPQAAAWAKNANTVLTPPESVRAMQGVPQAAAQAQKTDQYYNSQPIAQFGPIKFYRPMSNQAIRERSQNNPSSPLDAMWNISRNGMQGVQDTADNVSGGTAPSWNGQNVIGAGGQAQAPTPGVNNVIGPNGQAQSPTGPTNPGPASPAPQAAAQAAPQAPTTTWGEYAQGLAAKGQLDMNWWNAFMQRHTGPEGQPIDPIEYYMAGGSYPTPELALQAAQADNQWGQKFQATTGRPPNDDEWRYHWFEDRNIDPNTMGARRPGVPSGMTSTAQLAQNPSGMGGYSNPSTISRQFPPPPKW